MPPQEGIPSTIGETVAGLRATVEALQTRAKTAEEGNGKLEERVRQLESFKAVVVGAGVLLFAGGVVGGVLFSKASDNLSRLETEETELAKNIGSVKADLGGVKSEIASYQANLAEVSKPLDKRIDAGLRQLDARADKLAQHFQTPVGTAEQSVDRHAKEGKKSIDDALQIAKAELAAQQKGFVKQGSSVTLGKGPVCITVVSSGGGGARVLALHMVDCRGNDNAVFALNVIKQ